MSRIDARGRGARTLFAAASVLTLALPLATGCSRGGYGDGRSDASARDAQKPSEDAAVADLVTSNGDGSSAFDFAAPVDLAGRTDFAAPPDLSTGGPITGGPCMATASGATAFRVRWTDGGSGRASVSYEVHGLPDKTRWKVGVFGYTIGFTPQYVDPFLGSGGLQLDGSSFIDVELSTVGVRRLTSVTLAIFGRSYSTGSSGSFNWMTFTGSGATATNYVSNAAPYRWYPADAIAAIPADNGSILLRIKAGGSSGSLVVNRLELCIDGG